MSKVSLRYSYVPDIANDSEPLASVPSNKLFSLAHTAVVVTGGARGLGLATAIALLESHSPHVYCTDILPSPSEAEWEIALNTAKKYGSKVEYRQLDITNEEAVDATFESMYNDCETEIGAFFGAAGIQQQIPALDYPAKDFRRIMEVNVTGGLMYLSSPSDRADCQAPSCRFRRLLGR
jgi:NAD(P)-dependent dehydrogenase (short-subunit alcohol dehydrogenase family)